MSDLYEEHSKEAVALEKALEKLNARLEQQKTHWEEGLDCLESLNGEGMIRKCEAVIKDLKAVPGLVEAYEKKADQMERALKKSREKFVSEEDLKESSRGPLTKEIRSYETYISQDGERRNMIRGLTEKSRKISGLWNS